MGRSQLSAVLDRSGRLQAFFFVVDRGDHLELLAPEGAAEAAAEHLERHVIADDVSIGLREVGPMRIALGPEAVRWMSTVPGEEVFPVEAFGSRGFVTWADAEMPFPTMPDEGMETLRVVSGLPEWGREAVPGMLVNESYLVETAVSMKKGCYLGQETVAKIASHRGAARFPVLLRMDVDPADPSALVGCSFAIGDRAKAGTVVSWASWDGGLYLQASLFRDFRVEGLDLRCVFDDGGELAARVTLLPLIDTPSPMDQARGLYHAAVAAFTADRETEAVDLLERAIAVCPEHADAYESLGVILGRQGRYDEAIGLMDRLLEVDPDSVMAHTNKSVYFNQLGRIEDAEREGRAAAVKEMELKRRDRGRAEEVKRSREAEQADLKRREEMFRQVLKLDQDDSLGNFGMGGLCLETGRFDAAIEHLEKAIAVDREYSAAYLTLGRAWEGKNRPERAREIFTLGIEVAARRGDMATANKMQERIARLDDILV